MTIAIDFGTSNTVITRWNAATGTPETLKLSGLSVQQGQNPPLIPSLIYIQDAAQGKVVIGQKVRSQGLDIKTNPRFFSSFKRGIGSPIQGFLPEIDGQVITFEKVGEWFLKTIIDQLKASSVNVNESLILTVPVDSFEAYRHWLGSVCQALPVEQVRMLDEPTAAALGYGLADRQLLLVVDFGGGTLDLSLVRLEKTATGQTQKNFGFILKWGEKNLAESPSQKAKTARVLAKAGQNLGGTDIDNWIVNYFAKNQNLPIFALTNRLCERLKIQLSLQQKATEVYFNDETLETYELHLNRPQLEAILAQHQFLETCDEAMNQVLQQARRQGIEISDIDAVLLVGGTTQIPAVQTWIQQYFPPTKIRYEKPFEAIAQGALQLTQGIEVKDFLYHSYGIRYWNRRDNCHSWHPIIQSGQAYPMQEPVELVLGASIENQPNIELVIGELASQKNATEVYFDGGRLITKNTTGNTVQALNDKEGARSIAKLDPPGFPGSDRIKLFFQVDQERFLRLTVEDILTNQTLLNNQPVVQLN